MTATRRDLLKFATAVGIAGVLPATTAAAKPHADPIDETFTGMFIDMSAEPDPGYPVYQVWESSAGVTVERLGPSGETIVRAGHGRTMRAAIDSAIDVTRVPTAENVRVLHRDR
jgi:hypothetical protein